MNNINLQEMENKNKREIEEKEDERPKTSKIPKNSKKWTPVDSSFDFSTYKYCERTQHPTSNQDNVLDVDEQEMNMFLDDRLKKIVAQQGEQIDAQGEQIDIQEEKIDVQEGEQRDELRIVAWNPNGIRALLNKNGPEVKRMILEKNPHIVIFNETKGNEKMLKDMKKCVQSCFSTFNWYWNNSLTPGRHGCAVGISQDIDVISVNYGFDDGQKEHEGRLITLELNDHIIVGLYAVNAGNDKCNRLDYKIEWMGKLSNYLEQLKTNHPTKMIIAAGDWNVAPEEIDIHNPKGNQKSAGFTKQERDCFRNFLKKGWIDVFRQMYPNEVAYTFWNTKFSARKTNKGWRIDHFVINSSAFEKVVKCEILDNLGSDHAPIYLQTF